MCTKGLKMQKKWINPGNELANELATFKDINCGSKQV
jgi:hypothetical protein